MTFLLLKAFFGNLISQQALTDSDIVAWHYLESLFLINNITNKELMSVQAILRNSLKLEFAYSDLLTYADMDLWYQLHEEVEEAREKYKEQLERERPR